MQTIHVTDSGEVLYVGKRVLMLDETYATIVRIDERGVLARHRDGRNVYLADWML